MPEVEPERIAGVVLAAGRSTRMGCNKLMLELDGETLVRRAARIAEAGGLAPVVVVVGFEEGRVRDELRELRPTIVTNPAFAGPSSLSFHVGLRALPSDVDAAVVVLPDMVHVSRSMIRGLVSTAQGGPGIAERSPDAASPPPLVVSRYGGVTAPPILFRRKLFDELLAWTGEGCGRPVVRAHAAEAAYLDWPSATLDDVDTPDDWEQLARSQGT